jgi:hypothetical protein
MSTLRQVCAAVILSLTIVVSTSAGDIHSPGKASTEGASSTTTTVILTLVNLIYG